MELHGRRVRDVEVGEFTPVDPRWRRLDAVLEAITEVSRDRDVVTDGSAIGGRSVVRPLQLIELEWLVLQTSRSRAVSRFRRCPRFSARESVTHSGHDRTGTFVHHVRPAWPDTIQGSRWCPNATSSLKGWLLSRGTVPRN